jgi:TPR repeat protein
VALALGRALALAIACGGSAMAQSAYAPDASQESIARLRLRCHLSLTCPLSARDYEVYRRAMEGDHDAEAQMGRKLERGEGMAADRDAAALWYGRGAEAGDVRAALELNRLFRAGVPLHADDARIAASLRMAINAGNADAMRALADMMFYGRGVPRDEHGAFSLLREAATSGSAAAAAAADLARLRQAGGAR